MVPDTLSATLQLPPEEEFDRIEVTATSRSQIGLRRAELNPWPRFGISIYATRERIEIVPEFSCMEPDGKTTFQARLLACEGYTEVLWRAEKGRIDVAGNYTAPTQQGQGRVTVISKDDPNLFATAMVQVSDGCTSWELSVDGVGTFTGDRAMVMALRDEVDIAAMKKMAVGGVSDWIGLNPRIMKSSAPRV